MIIRELQLNHFGKFHEKEIELKPGINLIYGDNEAGKTTVHHFIRAMLFGVERLRGKGAANDEYTRYFPWASGRAYEGIMILEHEGRTLRLYRNFCREAQAFRVFDHETGEEIILSTGRIEELIPGLNEANFKNTISIGQQEHRIDDKFALSLQTYLANMSMTKDESVDIRAAQGWLSTKEKEMKAQIVPISGHAPVSASAADAQVYAGDAKTSMEEQLSEAQKQLTQAEQSISALEKQIAKTRHIVSEARQLEQRERMEGVRLLEERRHLMQSLKDEEDAAEVQGRHVRLIGQRSFQIFLVLTAAAVLFMLVQLGLHLNHMSFKILTGVLLLGAFAALGKTSFKKPVDEIDVKEYEQQLSQIQERLEPYREKYGMRMTDSSQGEILQKELDRLTAGRGSLHAQREKAEWRLEQLKEQSMKQAQQDELLKEQAEKNRKIRTELEAIALAQMVIRQLSGEIQKQFGGRMNETVADIYARISGQEKGRVMIDDRLDIHLDGMTQKIPLDRLSMGAVDQMYFALRFSAAQLIFENREMPFILDDCFAYYDDGRLERMLAWLGDQDCAQIILFTCHHREEEILKKLGISCQVIQI